jgi:hypothetical protein
MRRFLKLLVPLALVFGFALSDPAPARSMVCPDGSFQCTCNGIASCQTSILDCWNSC